MKLATIKRLHYNAAIGDAPTITSLVRSQLDAENEGFGDFAETVWSECEQRGYYDDSELGDGLVVLYLAGDPA